MSKRVAMGKYDQLVSLTDELPGRQQHAHQLALPVSDNTGHKIDVVHLLQLACALTTCGMSTDAIFFCSEHER